MSFSWDPFEEVRRIRKEIDKMLSDLLRWPKEAWSAPKPVAVVEGQYKEPLIDVQETESDITVLAELPGVNKDDIQVNVVDDNLELKASLRREHKVEEERYVVSERRYVGFYRKVRLPAKVDVSKAKASFKNGVLEVKLPKAEASKKVQIKVE